MSPLRYVAAFRTYAWDEDIAELARRFFAAVPSARQIVLADETGGALTIPGYEKISHTRDTASAGMPDCANGRSLWFNVDYGVYYLQRALPDFDYYLLSESDLAVNVPLEPMIRFAMERRIDLMAHKIVRSTPDWFWHKHGLVLSRAPWRSLLFLMILSRRAIEYMAAARQTLEGRYRAGEIDLWPFCEAFVPTVLKGKRGMRFAGLDAFADTANLQFRPRLSLHDPRANRPGSLAHSVVGGKKYIADLLAKHPPYDFFREGSELRNELISHAPVEDIIGPLRHALAKAGDHHSVVPLYEQAAAQGWRIDACAHDLAFCKPALSSSVSPWSHSQDPERDACGANREPLASDYGFHTGKETNAWWMVDLLGEHIVEELVILNRKREAQRFRTFRIETSRDGSIWTNRFIQAEPADISSNPSSPWRKRFSPAFAARYLRIVLLGPGTFHLRRVQIFGRVPATSGMAEPKSALDWPAGPITDLALDKPALSSSVSRWSRHQDRALDARGANSQALAPDYAFHTQLEAEPWWMVDLLDERIIEEVAIVNRETQPQRFRIFRIDTSRDGIAWTTCFTQAEAIDVSSDAESPWRMRFAESIFARYLRITMHGTGCLHLRRVQVFGRTPSRPRLPID